MFDLDFGRVGLATCFDMNFMEAWAELDRARVDVVFWPSAYGGGMPIRAYSALYRFAIVPAGWGDITLAGGIVAPDLKQEKPNLFTGKRHLFFFFSVRALLLAASRLSGVVASNSIPHSHGCTMMAIFNYQCKAFARASALSTPPFAFF